MSTTLLSGIPAGEAARRLRISAEHLRRLAVAGRIDSVRTPYGRVYDPFEVERLREERDEAAQARETAG
jgi:hypothetical protein